MKRSVLLSLCAVAAAVSSSAQDIQIQGLEDGQLTVSNAVAATQRTLYTVEWRSSLTPNAPWTASWSGLQEVLAPSEVVRLSVPRFFRVAAYPDLTTQDTNELMLLYSNAVHDAAIPHPNKVSDRLTAVVPANTNLSWRTRGDGTPQVKVVSFMSQQTATRYYLPGERQLSYGTQWVTVYPELKEFCSGYRGLDPLLRIKQVLGMPPTANGDSVVEFWVNPDYLFRPTPEPAINSSTAGLACSPNAPLLNPTPRLPSFWPEWFNATYASRNYGMTNDVFQAWPWTQLGYTYDWASTRPNHVGLSEFVIPSGALWNVQSNAVPIEVEAILPAASYGRL